MELVLFLVVVSHKLHQSRHVLLKRLSQQTTQVIKDSRFKLASALRAAGLHQSKAAQEAVNRVFVRPQLAIHGLI